MSALPDHPPTNTSETSAPAPPVSNNGKLSSTLVTNITIMSIVGIASILIMLFGDFEGKISRVLSTLILFGFFVFFSSRKMIKNISPLHMSTMQIGNIYMLVLSLILIWGSLAISAYEDLVLLPFTLFIAVLVQVGVLGVQSISVLAYAPQKQLSTPAILSTAGLAALTVLFTLPLGFHNIADFSELYWKFAVAVTLFTGLTLSITVLVRWAYRNQEESHAVTTTNSNSYLPQESIPTVQQPKSTGPTALVYEESISENSLPPRLDPVENHPQNFPHFAPPVPTSMPWPVFPNGQPLPVKPNGRPDFEALQEFARHCSQSERQFFS